MLSVASVLLVLVCFFQPVVDDKPGLAPHAAKLQPGSENILMVIKGTKTLTIFPPWQAYRLYPFHSGRHLW